MNVDTILGVRMGSRLPRGSMYPSTWDLGNSNYSTGFGLSI